MKRIAVLLLALITLFTFASCNESKKKQKEPEKVALENVYLTEKIALPDGSDIYNMCVSGDKIYLRGSKNETYTDEEGNEQYKYKDLVYVTDKTFSDFGEFFSYEGENYWDEETMESSSTYFNGIHPDGKGGIWITIASYRNMPLEDGEWLNENNTIIYHYGADGVSDREIDCKEILGLMPENPSEDVITNFYVNNVTESKDGILFILTNSGVVSVMPDGTVKMKSFGDNKNVNNIAVLENGCLRALCYDWSGEESNVEVIDYTPTTDQLNTVCKLSVNDNIMMDPEGNVYTDDYYVVSRVDASTGEEKPMLDWINSDINCDRIFQTTIQSGEIFTFEWDNDYSKRSLLRLTPAGEGDIIEKYIITLAANTISSELKNMIIDYNRTSADYRIQVKAYGWEDSATDKFDMDILAGNVPDLICLDQLNAEKYASKGILADLGAMLDADGELSRDAFLPNVIEAAEIRGKLYRLPSSFSVRSLMGKKSVVGDRTTWTWDDFLNVMKQYPDAEMLSEYSRQTLWDGFFPLIIEDFINYDTGKSNFTDGSFAKFLEYAKTLPAEIDWETFYEGIDWEEYENRYKENKAILVMSYLSSFNGDYYTVENFGEPTTYIGFPTASGNGNAIAFSSEFAIGEKSVYKEQAWDFLKMVFSEDYQSEYIWEIPVIKTVFEQKKQDAINSVKGMNDEKDYPVFDDMEVMPAEETLVEEDIAVEEPVEDVIISEDVIVEKPIIGMPRPTPGAGSDEETKAKMLEYIEASYQVIINAGRLVRYNDPMVKVIADECQPYFDGKKSLEETCKIIESRVNLYLAENM